MNRRIRKQVHELDALDFEAYPAWAYASDEEDRPGQDECAIRPLRVEQMALETGQVFVQAAFLFPNGRIRLGVVTLNAGEDPSGHQPVLFLEQGNLHFYKGASEPKKSEVRAFVRQLTAVCSSPFPIQYVSALRSAEGMPLAAGALNGLYWLANWQSGELRAAA